ncbi:corticotropin-releasing factor-binding protein isoform X2 [Tribolium castaneum]|uniref:corticotropin-releasing factor-binding protein isoform X2 n=1 Tax=Tribolium castaneum TaxID=7070 RepID=UPI00046C18FC|nr:PREDICTED: corticotropin-releasing factor-binding protein isoform X2 [Tribolium castaneum]|eukprot:XP_008201043.1 PREDICTED: corticotropin-releasing factor-binding protein isoform X2 [Tribolium castaneum]
MTPLAVVLTLFSCSVLVIRGHPGFEIQPEVNARRLLNSVHLQKQLTRGPLAQARSKRTSDHIITDCIFMTSEEGDFYHKSSIADGTACGAYIFSDPDQTIEVHFNYLDVPCENGGLVSFVDGWELNGEFFPSPSDHPLPLNSRFTEFCGKRKVKQTFKSSQNVALIQYRMPAKGTSFGFSVRFIKNPTPCNVLFQSTEDIYTLRNYGKRSNCSLSTLFPAAVRVASLNVGIVPSLGRGIELETGTIHKCQKRGLDDYLQIGGSRGLDNANLLLADSVCGLDSKPGKHVEVIACGTTTVRLVSSGAFDNSATVAIRGLTEDDINGYMSVFCQEEALE